MRDVVSPVLTAGAPTPLGSFPLLGEPEALEALAAAAAAWGEGREVWPTITVAARIDCVERFVSSMIAVRESVVETLVWEIGKSQPDSEKEFDRTVAYVRDTIAGEVALLIDGLANQVCRVNLNSQCQQKPDVFPFTGRKDSAEGTLSVSDAVRAFSIRSMAAAKDTPENRAILGDIVLSHRSSFLSTDWLF